MSNKPQFGLHTFGDVTADLTGKILTQAEVIRHIVDQGVLADQAGIDVIGVGEHHRHDFAVSEPDLVLSAIATRTRRIHLTTAVTVLSSDDPVRLYERFATLDAISNGRAEITMGRGSFIESFPLFGYDLNDYNVLFEEKLDLFAQLRSEEAITWSGKTRAPLANQQVYPKTIHPQGIPTWVGVGGTPESVVRTAKYGFGLSLAIIGGPAARFRPFVDLFHESLTKFQQPLQPIGIHSFGHVGKTDDIAREEFWPHYKHLITGYSKERGWPMPTIEQFNREIDSGSLYVGSPETVAKKIANTLQILSADRFDMKYSNGTLPHEYMMSSIELYGTKVAPIVRDMLNQAV